MKLHIQHTVILLKDKKFFRNRVYLFLEKLKDIKYEYTEKIFQTLNPEKL